VQRHTITGVVTADADALGERGRGLVVVLLDVRGLSVDQARETITGAAITLIDAALAQAGTESDSPN
jgi:hypothetical protein